jgi:hypothetical protein
MLTVQDVTTELTSYPAFHPFAAYITQIANIYVTAGMDQTLVLAGCVSNAAGEATASTPAAYRDAFIAQCNEWDPPPGAEALVRAVPLPPPPLHPVVNIPPPPVNYKSFYAVDIARIRGLRTRTSIQNGRRLAATAKSMKNWFRWIGTGPREPGFQYHDGIPFGLRTAWTAKRTDNFGVFPSGIETHDIKWDNFAKWLVENDEQPDYASYMNCWEAVFFSAWRANLVTKLRLQQIHQAAALAYRNRYVANGGRGGAECYDEALKRALNFFASAPFKPEAGLIPREGDIVFWDGLQHVAISLGRTWASGEPDDRVMSLWHNPFEITSIDVLSPYVSGRVTFVPCPF